MAYEIRLATRDDLPELSRFFREAYGEATIFQDERFLLWYFGRGSEVGQALSSAVAVTEGGAIAAHYGFLPQRLLLPDGSELTLAWGVSAYTLPQHRAMGLGQKLLMHVLPGTDVFGVIGFTPRTASFYEALGFQLFEKKRFKRFAFPLSQDLLEVTDFIATSRDKAAPLLARGLQRKASFEATAGMVRSLSSEDVASLGLPPGNRMARISRDREYLKWRFFENPTLNYEMLGLVEANRIRAYLVQRREPLRPTPYFATRIVDVNGDVEALRSVISYSLQQSMNRNDVFLDFEVFGNVYDRLFESLGFDLLSEDDTALLPRVSDPLQARPNHEYVGLYSAERMEMILALSEDSAVFMRADSDRDRAARVSA